MTTRSFDRRWLEAVEAELAANPVQARPPLLEGDLAGLPDPVRRYVLASGAVGRPVPQNMRVEVEAQMVRKPGGPPMPSTATQLNGFGSPTRLFLMKARMFGLPVRALHLYRREQATFQVRVAGLVTIVDQSGDGISTAETVTVLNDMCVFAPGTLVDPRLAWEPVDDRTARVVFTNGPRRVSATLVFNERDELEDFWSDDRPESGDNRIHQYRWHTPLTDYRPFDGVRISGRGRAVYDRPDGPFTYGDFTIRSVAYDIARA